MKKLRPLLIAWAAGLALWLLLGCVSLAKTAWYAGQGLAATQSLTAADFTTVGIQPYDAGEEGPWYISTDGDPQLLWQGEGQCAFLARAAAPGDVRAVQARAQKAGAFCENTLRMLAE